MRYAQLEKVSETNSCANGRVSRVQILKVKSCGSVETVSGIVQIHPMHIGRKIRIERDLSKKINRKLTFVD